MSSGSVLTGVAPSVAPSPGADPAAGPSSGAVPASDQQPPATANSQQPPVCVATPLLVCMRVDESHYQESIEISASFNRRLSSERRLRLPFHDPQTGVAQNHSALFVSRRQRMPGFREGQLYSYPANRWRKPRRQYLVKAYAAVAAASALQHGKAGAPGSSSTATAGNLSPAQLPAFGGRAFGSVGGKVPAALSPGGTPGASKGRPSSSQQHSSLLLTKAGDASNASLASGGDATDSNDYIIGAGGAGSVGGADQHSDSMGAGGPGDDSKDSHTGPATVAPSLKGDLAKEWFFDDMDMHEMDGLDEPKSPADDEYDYDPRYGHKKKRKRRAGGQSGAGGRRGGGSGPTGEGRKARGGNSATGASIGGGSAGTGKGRGGRRKGTAGPRSKAEKAATTASVLAAPLHAEPPSFEMVAAAMHNSSHKQTPDVSGEFIGRQYL